MNCSYASSVEGVFVFKEPDVAKLRSDMDNVTFFNLFSGLLTLRARGVKRVASADKFRSCGLASMVADCFPLSSFFGKTRSDFWTVIGGRGTKGKLGGRSNPGARDEDGPGSGNGKTGGGRILGFNTGA